MKRKYTPSQIYGSKLWRSLGPAPKRTSGRGRKAPYIKSGSVGVVRKAPVGELKFKDFALANSAVVSAADATGGEQNPATILCLNGVGQGDTMSTRVGTKMTMKSIFINGIVEVPFKNTITAAVNNPTIYIALVCDKQTNGGTATGIDSENVFSNPSADAAAGVVPLRNMSYTERYQVLKTKSFVLQPEQSFDGTDGMSATKIVPFHMKVNLKDQPVKFQVATTTGYVGTIIDNSLHLIAFTNSTNMGPLLTYNARLRYRG